MRLGKEDFADIVRHTPLVSIDIVVRDTLGRVLLGTRRNEPAKGYWFVPGGRITKGETRKDAFGRLCREELNVDLTIDDSEFLGVYEHFYDTNFAEQDGFGTHYVVLAYSIVMEKELSELPVEQHLKYQWFAVDAIRGNELVHRHTRWYFDD